MPNKGLVCPIRVCWWPVDLGVPCLSSMLAMGSLSFDLLEENHPSLRYGAVGYFIDFISKLGFSSSSFPFAS